MRFEFIEAEKATYPIRTLCCALEVSRSGFYVDATEPPFAGGWALTLLDLGDHRTNPLLLPAEPTGFANASDGAWGAFVMETQPYLEIVRYDTLLYEQIALPSLPVFVGVMPDLQPGDGDAPPAWVSQQHALGRIGLYDVDDASLETITGFELNSGIE